jgi:hypothetical protein
MVAADYITDLSLMMQLRDRENRLLFKDYFQVGLKKDVAAQLPERSVEAFLKDRGLLDGSLRKSVSLVVAHTVEKL